LALALAASAAFAAKEFVMPTARPAGQYPAHEQHSDEGVTIAIEPYETSEKADIFTLDYNEAGILPVFLVITNDSDQPVSFGSLKTRWITADRTKLSPANSNDIYRRFAKPRASVNPYPIPGKKVKGGLKREQMDELERAQFSARAVEPHSTQAGFLFFDVSGISSPLRGARFSLSGLQDAKGGELFYFEIPLEKYLGGAPASAQ
jgi:hypothetical protein